MILVFERLVPPQIPNRQATSSNPFERPTCSMGAGSAACGASLVKVTRDGARGCQEFLLGGKIPKMPKLCKKNVTAAKALNVHYEI